MVCHSKRQVVLRNKICDQSFASNYIFCICIHCKEKFLTSVTWAVVCFSVIECFFKSFLPPWSTLVSITHTLQKACSIPCRLLRTHGYSTVHLSWYLHVYLCFFLVVSSSFLPWSIYYSFCCFIMTCFLHCVPQNGAGHGSPCEVPG